MAYTLMAESKNPVDWPALHAAVKPIRRRVELFPVPPDGLGLSIPQRQRNELAWEEIEQLSTLLRDKFAMVLVDLQTGQPVPPEAMESLKEAFLVPDCG
ncbi:MAG TPA: hypothetical protein VEJ18_11265 [Planctomycetota bacterium]|nr:hypothetical protein [Planctomycetota bacterium]